MLMDLENISSLVKQIGSKDDIGKTDLITHTINTGNTAPIK